MKRVRGCGGRFLNTKKLEGNNSNAQEKGNDTGTSANPSKISGSNENLGSSNGHLDEPDAVVRHTRKVQSFLIGSHDGNCLPSIHYSQLNAGDCLAQERQSLHMHGATNGAVK